MAESKVASVPQADRQSGPPSPPGLPRLLYLLLHSSSPPQSSCLAPSPPPNSVRSGLATWTREHSVEKIHRQLQRGGGRVAAAAVAAAGRESKRTEPKCFALSPCFLFFCFFSPVQHRAGKEM